jgi:outer membrane scaffolding protein for murein synthesis (MipA/OmpV family)
MKKSIVITAPLLLFCLNSQAGVSAFEIQAKVGSSIQRGISASSLWELSDQTRLRFNISRYDAPSQQHKINLVQFTESKQRTDLALLMDYKLSHHWETQGWFVTTGLVHLGNGSNWDANPELKASYTLNKRLYSGLHLDEPSGRIEHASLSPYLGLGWHSSVKKGWQIGVDAGVTLATNPRLVIKTGNPYQLPFLKQDLQAEADKYTREVSKNLSVLKNNHFHLGLTVTYRF